MERHHSARPLVGDLDLEAEDVAELTLERFDVGVDPLRRIAGARPGDVAAGVRAWSARAAPALPPAAPKAPCG